MHQNFHRERPEGEAVDGGGDDEHSGRASNFDRSCRFCRSQLRALTTASVMFEEPFLDESRFVQLLNTAEKGETSIDFTAFNNLIIWNKRKPLIEQMHWSLLIAECFSVIAVLGHHKSYRCWAVNLGNLVQPFAIFLRESHQKVSVTCASQVPVTGVDNLRNHHNKPRMIFLFDVSFSFLIFASLLIVFIRKLIYMITANDSQLYVWLWFIEMISKLQVFCNSVLLISHFHICCIIRCVNTIPITATHFNDFLL